MRKPVSFAELSTQRRLIWLVETADAVKPDGATGGAGLTACTDAGISTLNKSSKSVIQERMGLEVTECFIEFKGFF